MPTVAELRVALKPDLDALRAGLQQARRNLQGVAAEAKITEREMAAAAKRAANEQAKALSQVGREAARTFRQQEASVAAAEREWTAYARTMERESARAYASVRREIEQTAATQARATRDRRDGFGGAGALVGGLGIGVGVGAAVAAGLRMAATESANFDQAMRNVNSIAQLSEEQFASLAKQVRTLAEDPQILSGPKELAAALYDVVSSGFSGQQALDVVKVAAEGATAGMTDAATAGKGLMAVLNSGIPGVKSANEAMDVLFQTVNRGVVTFEQLSGSIGAVLPIAAKAGISLQEVGAFIAVATKQGQSGADAINDLNNLITKLIRPSDEAAKMMREYGISFGLTGLQAKGLGPILAEITEKTHGNQDALARLFPDMQAFRGLLAAGKDGGKGYRLELEAMGHATDGIGAKQKALNEQLKGAGSQWQLLNKDVQILAVTVGDQLAPALRDAVGWLDQLVKKAKEFDPEKEGFGLKWKRENLPFLPEFGPTSVKPPWQKRMEDFLTGRSAAQGDAAARVLNEFYGPLGDRPSAPGRKVPTGPIQPKDEAAAAARLKAQLKAQKEALRNAEQDARELNEAAMKGILDRRKEQEKANELHRKAIEFIKGEADEFAKFHAQHEQHTEADIRLMFKAQQAREAKGRAEKAAEEARKKAEKATEDAAHNAANALVDAGRRTTDAWRGVVSELGQAVTEFNQLRGINLSGMLTPLERASSLLTGIRNATEIMNRAMEGPRQAALGALSRFAGTGGMAQEQASLLNQAVAWLQRNAQAGQGRLPAGAAAGLPPEQLRSLAESRTAEGQRRGQFEFIQSQMPQALREALEKAVGDLRPFFGEIPKDAKTVFEQWGAALQTATDAFEKDAGETFVQFRTGLQGVIDHLNAQIEEFGRYLARAAQSAQYSGARAGGGSVSGGGAYLVGERGPELFVPRGSGTIVPNGGGRTVNVTMHVSTPDVTSFRRSQGQVMTDLARAANYHLARTG